MEALPDKLELFPVLERAVAAHGGWERWREVSGIEVDFTARGKGLTWKRQGNAFRSRTRASISTREQRVTLAPFLFADQRGIFTPNRVAIQRQAELNERVSPRDRLLQRRGVLSGIAPWDDLDLLYFAGYALWNYFNMPFLLCHPAVEVEPDPPLVEGETSWEGVRVTFPDAVATHGRNQSFYFDEKGLLRVHLLSVDVIAPWLTLRHLWHDYEPTGGLMFARRHVVYVNTGYPRFPSIFEIDVENITLVRESAS